MRTKYLRLKKIEKIMNEFLAHFIVLSIMSILGLLCMAIFIAGI